LFFLVSQGSTRDGKKDAMGVGLFRDQVISSDGVTYVDASRTFSGSS